MRLCYMEEWHSLEPRNCTRRSSILSSAAPSSRAQLHPLERSSILSSAAPSSRAQLHPLERSSFLCSMMPRAGWRARSIPALAGTQLFPRPPHLNRAR
jgi:hypothetical protein